MYSKAVELAKDAVLKITSKNPVIISIDSIERYEINNIPLMRATAALVGCASNFNVAYVSKGIHVKVFLSAEIFSCLCEDFIENTGKDVQNPLYLHWKPKDLVRLISWRFYKYLNSRELIKNNKTHDIDWGNFQAVFEHMWIPYFGICIYNSKNIKEDTFPYVLRHTQMRPRQLIKLCNSIAEISADKDEFPIFTQQAVVNGIRKVEKDLAVEVINSYSGIYPNAGRILDALAHKPVIFKAKALDKYAKESSSDWPKGDYSPGKFRQLLAEMGVIGVVRRGNYETGIFEADFEYAIQDRLPIPNDEHCVIHPMFYEKLRITNDEKIIVFPFPDHPDFDEVGI